MWTIVANCYKTFGSKQVINVEAALWKSYFRKTYNYTEWPQSDSERNEVKGTAARKCLVKNFFLYRPDNILIRPDDILISPDELVFRPEELYIVRII